MRKQSLLLVLAAALFIGCATAGRGTDRLSLMEAIEQSAKIIASEIPPGSRVAIAAFESGSDNLSDFIIEALTNALFYRDIFTADRQAIGFAFGEFDLLVSGFICDESAQAIGRFLGAQLTITGQLWDFGSIYSFQVRAVHTETAAPACFPHFDLHNNMAMRRLLRAINNQRRVARTDLHLHQERPVPDNAGFYLDRGINLALCNNFYPAIEKFNEAIRLDPYFAAAYLLRGRALFASASDRRWGGIRRVFFWIGDSPRFSPEQASAHELVMADFSQAIQLDPDNVRALRDRGHAHRLRGDFDLAIADYSEAIRLEPTALMFNNRGITHSDRGDLDLAIADYNEAIRLNPNFYHAFNNRGNAHFNRGDLDLAIADYNEAIRLNPNFSSFFNNRGLAHFDRGDLYLAIADYTRAILLNPNNVQAFNNRGHALRVRGDLDLAIIDLSEAIRLDPTAFRFSQRGRAYLARGDFDLAIKDLSEAIRLEPTSLRFNNRGIAHHGRGDFDLAIADYTEAIRLNPNNSRAFYNRGNAHRVRGDFDLAIADYTEAIRLDPEFSMAIVNRGIVHRARGDLDLAIADYTEAIRLNPNDALAFFNRGIAFRFKGDLDSAAADWEAALRINPNLPRARQWIEEIQSQKNGKCLFSPCPST
ncbi:MAG: tetratricopeptide repeat protein [Spirochaetes bacterium]|nr:tetratricopeptide repeat protein [Spirochaetota bacterium]